MDIKNFLRAVTVGSLAAFAVLAHAENYPANPINFIAPIPPGGSTEVLAREVAQGMSEKLGQSVVVQNRPGGAGSIGTAFVANSPPDGYTIVLVNSSHVINPHVYKKLHFDALEDLRPVSLMVDLPMGLFVHPSVPAQNLKELLALIKENPNQYSFATSGNGSAGHLTGQMFQQSTGVNVLHIPFRGSALAVNDVIGGQVPILIADVPVAAPHVKSGRLRGIAITSDKRFGSLPDIPTFQELGVKGMDLSIWIGVMAPAKTPDDRLRKLSDTIASVLKESEMADRVDARGFNIIASTPEAFDKVLRKDYERFGEVVRTTGVKVE